LISASAPAAVLTQPGDQASQASSLPQAFSRLLAASISSSTADLPCFRRALALLSGSLASFTHSEGTPATSFRALTQWSAATMSTRGVYLEYGRRADMVHHLW
jgi:hypothetical protein